MASQMKDAIDKTFEALFALEDLRQIWRDTAPTHTLSAEQKVAAQALLLAARRCVDAVMRSLER